ncbi:hypothetical protein [Phaeobacter italicus]|uniref:hypothetical protein n=1 Tax=Phaeobacter italicus TaxID=481446 RepID=UPI00248E69E5|nr:hypothetical protein [Phaeobacter italicus]
MTTYAVLSIMGSVPTGRCFRGVAACHAAVAYGRNLRIAAARPIRSESPLPAHAVEKVCVALRQVFRFTHL